MHRVDRFLYLILLIGICLCIWHGTIFAQYMYSTNKWSNFLFEQKYKDNLDFHASIQPFATEFFTSDSTCGNIFPVTSTSFGLSSTNKLTINFINGLGIIYKPLKKLTIQIILLENLQLYPAYIENKIDTNKIMPNWGKYWLKYNNFYFKPLLLGTLTYLPFKYLSVQAGINSYFIGNGYRSLLWSDNAPPQPYLGITTNFWRIEYMVRWLYLKDIDNTALAGNYVDKYGVMHYFDFKPNHWFSIGIFESIIWWGSDSLTKRGIDPAYLNPIIFFRPVEYAQHSPDNANLGTNISIRFMKNSFLYSQIFIDDMRIKDLLAGNNWWGNKYGLQVGVKTFKFLTVKNLFFQTEYNFVRPYTYSHATSSLNYGRMYHSLAHPLGANFREGLAIIRYTQPKWQLSGKFAMAQLGMDTSITNNVGQNIYLPYTKRITDKNGNANFLQGKKTFRSYSEFKLSRLIMPKFNFFIYLSIQQCNLNGINPYKGEWVFNIGLNTNFINDERDY